MANDNNDTEDYATFLRRSKYQIEELSGALERKDLGAARFYADLLLSNITDRREQLSDG